VEAMREGMTTIGFIAVGVDSQWGRIHDRTYVVERGRVEGVGWFPYGAAHLMKADAGVQLGAGAWTCVGR
jgi:hypothetical protein